jgi:hypothetical protein
MRLTTWWNTKRQTLTLGMLALSMTGKGLVLLAVGALWADALRPWAWPLIAVGIALDLTAKWRWLRRQVRPGVPSVRPDHPGIALVTCPAPDQDRASEGGCPPCRHIA